MGLFSCFRLEYEHAFGIPLKQQEKHALLSACPQVDDTCSKLIDVDNRSSPALLSAFKPSVCLSVRLWASPTLSFPLPVCLFVSADGRLHDSVPPVCTLYITQSAVVADECLLLSRSLGRREGARDDGCLCVQPLIFSGDTQTD